MQVLYQLSYGPIGVARRARHKKELTPCPAGGYTWRQTATSLPWMVTSSAGSRIGA